MQYSWHLETRKMLEMEPDVLFLVDSGTVENMAPLKEKLGTEHLHNSMLVIISLPSLLPFGCY